MKLFRRLFLFILILGVLSGAVGYAAPKNDYPDSFFEGRTLEEIMEEFIKRHYTIDGTVGAGYKNLVSGEEYYYMPDQLFLGASTYKVPLNMYWSNRVYNGEIGWDYQIYGSSYEKAQEWSIVNSNNEYSIAMWEKLGSFTDFRNLMLPYLGAAEDEMEPLFYKENYFTPRMMIHCLEELYTNSEKYPRVIDLMLRAKPGQYFEEHDNGVEIAHKFGYLEETILVVNDCAIVYTEEPIALVVFTQRAYNGYDWLVDFCDMMIAYTEYHTPLRLQAEAEAKREAEAAAAAAYEQRLAVFDSASEAVFPAVSAAIREAETLFENAVSEIAVESPERAAEETPADRRLAVYITAAATLLVVIILLFVSIIRRKGAFTGILGAIVLCSAAGLLLSGVLRPADSEEIRYQETPEEAFRQFSGISGGDADGPAAEALQFMISQLSVSAAEPAQVSRDTASILTEIHTADSSLLLEKALECAGSELQAIRTELEQTEGPEVNEEEICSRIAGIAGSAVKTACSSGSGKQTVVSVGLIYIDDSWKIIGSDQLIAALSTKG